MTALMGWLDKVTETNGIFLARLFIGLLFLVTGVMSLMNFEQTAGMIGSKGLPLAGLLAVIVIAMKIGGSAALISGKKVRYGALALIVFTILATVSFHFSWDQNVAFLKNLAIIGGLLLVYRSAKN